MAGARAGGGAGGEVGATNSSQFKVIGVANSVPGRASLMVMCIDWFRQTWPS